jgi:ribosomal-protein-alanine N-acetyltransferase
MDDRARPAAFALARSAADEAELLTLAVRPAARRAGRARRLLAEIERRAAEAGAAALFLEVSERNAPARALYAAAEYRPVARRRAYYGDADALILRKDLSRSTGDGPL